jgi:flavin-dependent dehydrogenase
LFSVPDAAFSTDSPTGEAPHATDVLVIGGGPAGAAAGYWLARHGHHVTIVERKTFPREKTCGDGLTPRAVHQLDEMGLTEPLSAYHRYSGLRAMGMGKSLELEWPSHSVYPQHGYVVRRRELDQMVARERSARRRHVAAPGTRPCSRSSSAGSCAARRCG